MVEQAAVPFQKSASAGADPIEILQRDYAQPLGWMSRDVAEQIVQPPHPLGKLRFGEHPSASQSAQAVSFGQTARGDEFISKMKGRGRGLIEQRFKIDLVNQHPRSHATGNLSKLSQRCVVDKRAAWIVQVSYRDQPRAIRYCALDFVEVNAKVLLETPLKQTPGTTYATAHGVLFRRFCCPGCAALLDTETALPGAPFLNDVVEVTT